MLKFLDDIPNYKADEEATAPTNVRLSQFFAFLEKTDYTRFFVWIEFENPELRWSTDRAPLFYEAGKCHMTLILDRLSVKADRIFELRLNLAPL